MLSAVREVQVPLLAALLLCACAAKAWRVARELITGRGTAGTRPGEGNPGIMDRALGPTALFPVELRRPVAIFMCASELLLGAGLILTATRVGARVPATAVRVGVAVFFLIALGALIELRERRPDVGCGCFGDLSVSPVGTRVIARAALLAVAAIATVGEPALRLPPSAAGAELRIVIGAAELIVLAALSPELGEALARLGYSEPCELRRIPAARTLGALTGSAQWRRYAGMIVSASGARDAGATPCTRAGRTAGGSRSSSRSPCGHIARRCAPRCWTPSPVRCSPGQARRLRRGAPPPLPPRRAGGWLPEPVFPPPCRGRGRPSPAPGFCRLLKKYWARRRKPYKAVGVQDPVCRTTGSAARLPAWRSRVFQAVRAAGSPGWQGPGNGWRAPRASGEPWGSSGRDS
jgi:hypothetical protein